MAASGTLVECRDWEERRSRRNPNGPYLPLTSAEAAMTKARLEAFSDGVFAILITGRSRKRVVLATRLPRSHAREPSKVSGGTLNRSGRALRAVRPHRKRHGQGDSRRAGPR